MQKKKMKCPVEIKAILKRKLRGEIGQYTVRYALELLLLNYSWYGYWLFVAYVWILLWINKYTVLRWKYVSMAALHHKQTLNTLHISKCPYFCSTLSDNSEKIHTFRLTHLLATTTKKTLTTKSLKSNSIHTTKL